jgi:hypothetical protein
VLILSLLTLFAGPLLYHWLRRGGLVARTFDQVMVAVLVVVVFALLLPDTLAHLGGLAVVMIAAGYIVPGLLESAVKSAARAFHLASLLLALAGLMLHALLDGAGLAGSEQVQGSSLALAIVLHRLGVGLIVWLMVQPAYGRRAAVLVLVLVAVATVLGFSGSEWVLPWAGENAFHLVQALIIGAIVHSLVHRGHGARAGQQHRH